MRNLGFEMERILGEELSGFRAAAVPVVEPTVVHRRPGPLGIKRDEFYGACLCVTDDPTKRIAVKQTMNDHKRLPGYGSHHVIGAPGEQVVGRMFTVYFTTAVFVVAVHGE